MIQTFADKHTQAWFEFGFSSRLPPGIQARALRKLDYVNLATCVNDLRVPPGNRLHRLSSEREGQYTISINDQWRICFRFVDDAAYEVEICDYH
jgi:proteic killer suppression protein